MRHADVAGRYPPRVTPERLGPYHLIAPLGRGGTGQVWRARADGPDVALKLVPTDHPATARALAAEVRAVAGLRHPGVVAVIDHGHLDGLGWIAMELADRTVAERPPRDAHELRAVVAQILEALAHAHAHDVVHRDLKPSNLLWVGGRVKVADFGIARVGEASVEARSGTPRYMAPEQLLGDDAAQGPWTDLYALGCCVVEWIEGAPPFSDAAGHLDRPPPPLRDPAWQDWVHALLRKAPEARPASAAAASRELPAAAGLTTRAPAPSDGPTATVATGDGGVGLAARTAPTRRTHLRLPARWPEAAAVPETPATLALFGLRPVPIVGREAERETLWSMVRVGSGAIVLAGTAGVGKSRLAEWLGQAVVEAGGRCWVARGAGEPGAASALGGMVARGTGLSRVPPGARLERARRWLYHRGGDPALAPALTALVDPAASPFRFRSTDDRHATLAEVLRLDGGPCVVWLDDVHGAADAAGFARWLLDRGEAVGLVATLRDDLPAEAARPLLDHPATHRLDLAPLPADHRRSLVDGVLALDDVLAARVADRTAGNPLFTVQLVRDWVARGLLAPGPSGWVLAAGADTSLPADVAQVWRARIAEVLEGLPPDATRALALAAALGVEVRGAEWSAAGANAGVLVPPALLDRLLDRNLARGTPDAWSFAHGMLREAVSAADPDPRATHLACAAALSADQLARVGRHLHAAGELRDCLEPLLRGARAANLALDYADALGLLAEREAAIDALDEPEAERLRALGAPTRVTILRNLGRFQDALAEVEAVVAREGDADWTPIVAEAWGQRAMLLQYMGQFEESIASVDRAEAAGREPGAVAHYRVASLISLRRYDEAGREAERGLASSDASARSELLRLRGEVLWRTGDLDGAVPWLERAWDAAEATGDRVSQMLIATELGAVRHLRADYTGADLWYRRAIVVVGGPDRADALVPRCNLAVVRALGGDPDGACDDARVVLALTEAMAWTETAAYARAVVWACTRDRAEQDALYGPMRAAIEDGHLVDGDFVLLARLVERRRTDDPGPARAFAEDQLRRGADRRG